MQIIETPQAPRTSVVRPMIMARLKRETRGPHERVEALAFSQAVIEERLPLELYVAQLHAYAVLHSTLDHLVATCSDPVVAAIWRDDLDKTSLLARDLEFLDPRSELALPNVQRSAAAYAEHLDDVARLSPRALLGHLYVMEGSTLGSMVLRKHLSRGLALPDEALHYFTCYGRDTMPHWRAFCARMNAHITSLLDQREAIDAANAAFEAIGDILSALSTRLHDTAQHPAP
ncbi:MAG: biliverdin-producing heme oxygenase [Myxococcota bacterium]